ncbi:MAG: ABC transporter permease [Desulfobulbaceae bacterium]|nr:ABC transporter permease [Desulfobulbaceae bacterium]
MKLFVMYCRIAFRNVKRNMRRSLLTVSAIAFGLFCLIIFQALKTGLHREMVSGTVNLDIGSLQIHAAGYEANLASLRPIENIKDVIDHVQKYEGVTYSARVKAPGLVLSGKNSATVILAGINPSLESTVTFIHDKVVAGAYLIDKKSVLIGKELADSLGNKVGDKITLMTQDIYGKAVARKFTVGGLYRTGRSSFNRTHVYINQEDAQNFLGLEKEWTEIALQTDPMKAENVAVSLQSMLPDKIYQIRTWEAVAPDLRQLIDLNDATMTLLILIVFAIVAMGVTNTMTTVIYERFHEIGVLTTIGTTPSGIVGMIVLESLFLGLAASLVGSVAAGLACLHLSQTGIDLTQFTSNNQYFTGSHILKTYLTSTDIVMANGVTLLTALLAGIYPALKASRIEPLKAIHHI